MKKFFGIIFFILCYKLCFSQSNLNRCFIDGFRLAAYDVKDYIGDLGLIDSTKPYTSLLRLKYVLMNKGKGKNAQLDSIQEQEAKQYIPNMFYVVHFSSFDSLNNRLGFSVYFDFVLSEKLNNKILFYQIIDKKFIFITLDESIDIDAFEQVISVLKVDDIMKQKMNQGFSNAGLYCGAFPIYFIEFDEQKFRLTQYDKFNLPRKLRNKSHF